MIEFFNYNVLIVSFKLITEIRVIVHNLLVELALMGTILILRILCVAHIAFLLDLLDRIVGVEGDDGFLLQPNSETVIQIQGVGGGGFDIIL
jgi:hypothetical protein